jgi:RsiW-degrading membrane proteinase PrsW (M82 family)
MNNNLLIVILAILPTFFYSLILFFMLPKNMISFRRMRKYFGIGLVSPLIVILFHYTFPDIKYLMGVSVFSTTFTLALFEEISKYSSYQWTTSNRKNSNLDYPIATMMYSLSAAAGFAIVENIHYAMMFKENPLEVTLIRGVTANILHLLCGLLIGYFIAKARMIKNPILKFEKLKKIRLYTLKGVVISFGIFVSSCFHTLYNANAMVSSTSPYGSFFETTYAIFVLGIFITYYMSKELISDSKKIMKERYGKK